MDSHPRFTIFSKLPSELRIRIWTTVFPILDTSPRTIRIHIRRAIHLLAITPSAYPTQIVYSYILSAPLVPQSPPIINREVHNEYKRQYPAILTLLPDPHNPATQNANPHRTSQRIRFNPLRDTIFVDLPSLYALYNIVPSPPDLSTLARFVGFDSIRHLSTPIDNPNITGLIYLTRWLFTGLPSTSNLQPSHPIQNLTTQVRSIATDLSFLDPDTDMTQAREEARLEDGYVHPNDREGQIALLRRVRRIHVQWPLEMRLSAELELAFRERGGIAARIEELRAMKREFDRLLDGMEDELWEFFEVRGV